MASRGWDGVTATDIARMQRKDAPAAKPSKYRNVKVVVDGERFDSKREAQYWAELKLREKAGEISELRRQVPFSLYAPSVAFEFALDAKENDPPDAYGTFCHEVCRYVADFTFWAYELGKHGLKRMHVVDAKGKRTAMYSLKKKWLELQSGIVIEEV